MRIWILNHYAAAPDRPGGSRHFDFGRAFVNRGHQVTIFASAFNHLTRRRERLAPGQRVATEEIDGVRFVWLRTMEYTRNDLRRVLGMLGYAGRVLAAQRRQPGPEVVIGSSVHLVAVLAAYVIARLRRATFVFEVRDLWPQTLIDLGVLAPGGLVTRVLRALERFLCRRADLIVCLLPGAVDYLVDQGAPRDRVVYVPNGSYPDRPGEVTDPLAVGPGSHPDPPPAGPARCEDTRLLLKQISVLRERGAVIAGYAGAHGAANQVEVLVEAAAVVRRRAAGRLALVLIGQGPDKAACQARAARYGLDNLVFADPVPRADLPAVLAALDIAVATLRPSPVHRYGISMNKLYDYLASGRPTIFAGVADNPVQAAGCGRCVPPGDPERVAEALLELASLTPAERWALGRRGQRYVREHHDIRRLADRLLAALAAVPDRR